VRIVCIAADAARNSLVRVYPIAKVLERQHEVVVAGFRSGAEIYEPYRDEFEYVTLRAQTLPRFARQVHTLARHLDADLIYAFKPQSASMWPGLAAARRLDVPLVVDIEDWELGWYLDRSPIDQLKHLLHLERPEGYLYTAVNDRLVRLADQRLVVSRFLQGRFGGALLPHGADAAFFDPARWDRQEALRHLGLPDMRYVVFTGTPMPNKGLEDLLTVMRTIQRPDIRLLVVGSFAHDPAYGRLLSDRFADLVTLVPPRPHAEMPLCLALAEVVALPQRHTRETDAQVPGKIYEAMAMARPILGTDVSDIPEILGGCGTVVPAEDHDALAAGLVALLDDAAEASRLGAAARSRCIEHYSWRAMEQILEAEFTRLTA
jgi:glycosyltransferase involved in cell wall biosynthesis